jgi:putative membrane protein
MTIADLPALNATLNFVATLFLIAGYAFIRNGDQIRHRACMIGALLMSAAFLTSYLVYHYHAGSVPFEGQGPIRAVYFTILITHIILAAVILPLVLVTVRLRGDGALREPPPPGAVDVAHLDVRLGDRRRDLPDAVPDVTLPRTNTRSRCRNEETKDARSIRIVLKAGARLDGDTAIANRNDDRSWAEKSTFFVRLRGLRDLRVCT